MGFAVDCLKVYENHAVYRSNNLRLNKMFILIFFQFNFKIIKKQLEIILEGTYSLQLKKCFKIMNQTFGGRMTISVNFDT